MNNVSTNSGPGAVAADLQVVQAVLDGIDALIYVADFETFELLHVNEAFKREWGDDVIGRKCYQVLHQRDAPCPFCTNDKILGEHAGKPYVWETLDEATGRWHRRTDRAIDWPDGRKVRFEIASDVTEDKRAESVHREADAEFRTFFEDAPIGKCVTSPTGELLRVNNTFAALLGYSCEELHEIPFAKITHPDDLPESKECVRCLLAGERDTWTMEKRYQTKDGRFVWTHVTTRLLRDESGRPLRFLTHIQDISDRKRQDEELRELNAALQAQQHGLERQIRQRTGELEARSTELTTIMDAMPALVFYKDAENRFVRVNKYLADAHNATKEEIEGKSCFELYPREQAQAYLDDDLAVMRSGVPKLDVVEPWQTEHGPRWISTSKIPYVDALGSIRGVIGVSADITERKRAEEALERKSRLTEATNRFFRETMSARTDEEVARVALRVAENLTGSRFGWIGELNAEGLLDTIAISNPGWDACSIVVSEAKNFIKNMPLRGIDRSALLVGSSRIVNGDEIATHPDRVGTPMGHPSITAFLGVPFKRDGKTVGMISLANREGGYGVEQREDVEAFAVAFYEVLLRKRMELAVEQQSLLRAGLAKLSQRIRGDQEVEPLCQNIITQLCSWLQVPTGIIYLADAKGALHWAAGHAHRPRGEQAPSYRLGEGQVGQAALEQREIVLEDLPSDYLTIDSGLGQAAPRRIHIKPIVRDGRLCGVLELGALHEFAPHQAAFLDAVTETIAYAIASSQARTLQGELLEETRRQSQELQAQQEELKATNEELEEQTQRLQISEARLKTQQEELQVTNEELAEKNALLERQKRDVEAARREITEKADELALASKYKSEFLANMSHELRTPLNSLLLLAKSLSDNKAGNLTDDQVESATVIYQAGNDLLSLINEILDLSRIEAGRMELHLETVRLSELAASTRSAFHHLAESKKLAFSVSVAEGAPEAISTDRRRVEQIIKNLVANAIKFTARGHVTVSLGPVSPGVELRSKLDPGAAVAIAIEDTGIGISASQQKVIFEAFQQADGSTSRRFGGTGLGLSIARELAAILGGEIQLQSEPGVGSTFALYVPIAGPSAELTPTHGRPLAPAQGRQPRARPWRQPVEVPSPGLAATISDDREHIDGADRSVLIIEDDQKFAAILARQCRERGFKVLAAATGEAGVDLARRYLPQGVLLDLKLPGMDGWRVLDLLKEDPATRHIPVHVASIEEPSMRALHKGAVGYLQKPVSAAQIVSALNKLEDTGRSRSRRVLVVEDDEQTRKGIVQLIAEHDIIVDEAAGGARAIEALRAAPYDCVILDLGLWDFDGDELLKRIEQDEQIQMPPVIVYTARELTWEEDLDLRSYSDSVIIKGVRSDERLLDEVSLFLHRVVSEMPEDKRRLITSLHDTDAVLRGKKVLLVDDDMRTLFALTKVLADREMQVLKAENGEKALEMLDRHPDVDVVLMDIMMPVLDGYEAMKRLRAQERFAKTPVIALTAKAMKGDQERCLAAGASDYLPKPVDQGRLLSMLRVWLYR